MSQPQNKQTRRVDSTLKLSPQGLAFIKGFEGFYPFVYDDLGPMKQGRYLEHKVGKVRGTLTLGYGHTSEEGPPVVVPGMTITESDAAHLLDVDLDGVEKDVHRLVQVGIAQHQFDMLVSFHFNTGKLGSSTLLKKINRGDMQGAADEFPKWRKSKGQVLKGLVRRRDAERGIFLAGYRVTQ